MTFVLFVYINTFSVCSIFVTFFVYIVLYLKQSGKKEAKLVGLEKIEESGTRTGRASDSNDIKKQDQEQRGGSSLAAVVTKDDGAVPIREESAATTGSTEDEDIDIAQDTGPKQEEATEEVPNVAKSGNEDNSEQEQQQQEKVEEQQQQQQPLQQLNEVEVEMSGVKNGQLAKTIDGNVGSVSGSTRQRITGIGVATNGPTFIPLIPAFPLSGTTPNGNVTATPTTGSYFPMPLATDANAFFGMFLFFLFVYLLLNFVYLVCFVLFFVLFLPKGTTVNSFGFSPFSMSNAIDLAELSKEKEKKKDKNGSGNSSNNVSNIGSPCVLKSNNNGDDSVMCGMENIPVATPQNTTTISFSNLGSLSAKKKTSQSPLPPPLLPQLSALSSGLFFVSYL